MTEFAMKRTWGPEPKYPNVINYQHPNSGFVVIAGPCSVESIQQIHTVSKIVARHGASHLRGGLFRAGTYPGKSFGLVDDLLLEAFQKAARENGLKSIIECLDYSDDALAEIDQYADCFQIGCRSMQNYTLLRKIAERGKPVFLKRNQGATIDELLGSCEHLLAGGAKEIYIIERGSSTNAKHVRWDLSISMIPAVQAITKIPILVDGSHGTGRRDLVEPMNLAGVASGANGMLVEVHPDPEKSLSDADQAISFDSYIKLMSKVNKIREALA